MVELIIGEKGKGKTKHLLNRVNESVKTANGNIVYLDKSSKHMYELDRKVRLIDFSTYLITNSDEFIGFISGIISQDHDLEEMYLDSFLKIAKLEQSDISDTIAKLEKISNTYSVKFVISISLDECDIPESVKPFIVLSL